MHKKRVYEGRIYVRPLDRGVVLNDADNEPHLDQWIAEVWPAYTDIRARIVIEEIESPEGPADR